MSKTPERPLCERCRKKPQRPGCEPFCLDCAIDDIREKNRPGAGPQGVGEIIPLSPPLEKGEEEKETEMSETPKCTGCHQPPKEGERLYGGKCPDCRSAGKAARKSPSPLAGEGKGEGEKKKPLKRMGGGSVKKEQPPPFSDTAEILTKVKGQLNYHIEEARKHRAALIVLKDMTGADIEIPEIGA